MSLEEGEAVRIATKGFNIGVKVYANDAEHCFNAGNPDMPLIADLSGGLESDEAGEVTFVSPKGGDYKIQFLNTDGVLRRYLFLIHQLSDAFSKEPLPEY